MRNVLGLIAGTAMVFAASSAWAQRYDPNYPVCMEVYGADGSVMNCFFTSMEQCKEGARGTGASCLNNPYYKPPPAQAAPEPSPTPTPPPKKKKR